MFFKDFSKARFVWSTCECFLAFGGFLRLLVDLKGFGSGRFSQYFFLSRDILFNSFKSYGSFSKITFMPFYDQNIKSIFDKKHFDK